MAPATTELLDISAGASVTGNPLLPKPLIAERSLAPQQPLFLSAHRVTGSIIAESR
jgi:hypothetical protein